MNPTGKDVIVDPYYESEKVFGLYMPDSGKNPMSQQGEVVAVGPQQDFLKRGDYILYYPFWGTPFYNNGDEYLHLKIETVVGIFSDTGLVLALPEDVIIAPDFKPAGRPVLIGNLYKLQQVWEVEPPQTGRIINLGRDVTDLKLMDRVVFPAPISLYQRDRSNAGAEIGVESPKGRRVVYAIPQRLILATLTLEV